MVHSAGDFFVAKKETSGLLVSESRIEKAPG